jgi:hypothetical protein
MITKGDLVRVHPHGSPDQSATGTVQVISANQRAIAVAFDHSPPFAFQNGAPLAIHPEHGIMFFAFRHEIGPWIEMMNMGHYEISGLSGLRPSEIEEA